MSNTLQNELNRIKDKISMKGGERRKAKNRVNRHRNNMKEAKLQVESLEDELADLQEIQEALLELLDNE